MSTNRRRPAGAVLAVILVVAGCAPGPAATPTAPRIAIAGDSVGASLAPGLAAWASASGQAVVVPGDTVKGCGFTRTTARYFGPNNQTTPPGCRTWPARARRLARSKPQITLLTAGMWDLLDARLPGRGTTWRTYGDPVYEAFVYRELLAVTDAYSAGGSLAVWLTTPDIAQNAQSVVGPRRPGSDAYVYSGRDNERVAHLNAIIGRVVAARPGRARLVDLHEWMAPRFADATLRPDGMHFEAARAASVIAELVGPSAIAAFRATPAPKGPVRR